MLPYRCGFQPDETLVRLRSPRRNRCPIVPPPSTIELTPSPPGRASHHYVYPPSAHQPSAPCARPDLGLPFPLTNPFANFPKASSCSSFVSTVLHRRVRLAKFHRNTCTYGGFPTSVGGWRGEKTHDGCMAVRMISSAGPRGTRWTGPLLTVQQPDPIHSQ